MNEEQVQNRPAEARSEGEKVYAVSYPPAMYAADILRSREFAEALGYAWLHDEDTEFVRTFREQVRRQAELYQQWLEQE
jgi:predicted restriction endonuclease